MLHGKNTVRENLDDDIYSSADLSVSMPKFKFPTKEHNPRHAYQVVADVLTIAEGPIDKKAVIEQSMLLGKQYRLQNRIAAEESVSQVLFASAFQLAENRGLLDEACTAEEHRAFGDEIRDVLRRVEVIESLATRRWAGH